jgi:hypothetical protein
MSCIYLAFSSFAPSLRDLLMELDELLQWEVELYSWVEEAASLRVIAKVRYAT